MRRLAYFALALVVLAAATYWAIGREASLRWAMAELAQATQGKLQFEGVQGGVLETITIRKAAYFSPTLDVQIENLQVRLSFWSLLRGQINVATLKAGQASVHSRPDDEPLKPPASLVPPLQLDAQTIELDRLEIRTGDAVHVLSNLRASLRSDQRQYYLKLHHLDSPWGSAEMEMNLAMQPPFALKAQARYRPPPAWLPPMDYWKGLSGDVSFSGSLMQTRVGMTLTRQGKDGGAIANAQADLQPFETAILKQMEIGLHKLDLRDLDQSLPASAIDGQLVLDAKGSGEIVLENQLPGRIDENRLPVRKLAAHLQLQPEGVSLSDARLTLIQGDALTGQVSLSGERYSARFKTAGLDLTALHDSLKTTRLAGSIEVDGDQAGQQFKLGLSDQRFTYALEAGLKSGKLLFNMNLAKRVFVPLSLRERARREGNGHGEPLFHDLERRVAMTDRQAQVQAGRSRLLAEGELDLSARRQPFDIRLRLSQFDPSAWGDFPAAQINASGTARGEIQPEWQAQLDINVSNSRFAGQALDGHLAGAWRQARLQDAKGELSLGKNHLRLAGALGQADDKLELDFDLADLSLFNTLLGEQISGKIKGQARLQGTPQFPALEAEIEGERVLAPGMKLSAQKLKLALKAAPSLDAPLAVSLQLDGAQAGAQRLGKVDVRLEGTGRAHQGSIAMAGKDVALEARMTGGMPDASHWSGRLEHLAGSRPWPLKLAQAVAVDLSRERIATGKADVTVGGARFELASFQLAPGRLQTQGRFSGLPLTLGRNATAAKGELTLAGEWNVDAAQHLNGFARIQRESGNLLASESGLEDGLKVRIVEAAIDIQARDDRIHAQARVATERGSEISAQVDTLAARQGAFWGIPGEAPLALQAKGEILYMDWVGPLIHPALSTGGKLSFQARAQGTVDHPDMQGELTGTRLSISEPGYGIRLVDGELKARFNGSELMLDELTLRGKEGELNASGKVLFPSAKRLPQASVDFRAQNLGLLDRPNWELNADAQGHFSYEQGKAGLQGSLNVNKARIGLLERGAPALSDDIVIKGRAPKTEMEQGSRIALDVSVDLGKDFRIRTLGEHRLFDKSGSGLRKLIPLYNNGIDAGLRGNLDIRTDPKGKPLAEGRIRVRDGAYTFMGKPLEIKRGTLRFDGEIDNPALDILARNEQTEVKVGVSVTGTAKKPRALLVSDPEVPEQEKLSWLLFGRGGETVDASLSKGTTGGMFGMQISDKFYVGYDQGAGATSSAVTLYGRLTDRLSIEARSGSVSAIRLFYLFNLRREQAN